MKKFYFLTLALICAFVANAANVTIYAQKSGILASKANLYYWNNVTNGPSWPGTTATNSIVAPDGNTYWKWTITATGSFNIVFNNGSKQTSDITNLAHTQTSYWYVVDANGGYIKIAEPSEAPTLIGSVNVDAYPTNGTLELTLSSIVSSKDVENLQIKYKVGNSAEIHTYSETNKPVLANKESITTWLEGNIDSTACKTEEETVYPFVVGFENTHVWSNVYFYTWNGYSTGAWPGIKVPYDETLGLHIYTFPATSSKYTFGDNTMSIIFNNNEGDQTSDLTANATENFIIFNAKGELTTAIEEVGVDAGEAVYYNLQGVKVANPENGIFIKKQGGRTSKVVL